MKECMFKNYEELPLFLNAETVTRLSMLSAEMRAVKTHPTKL